MAKKKTKAARSSKPTAAKNAKSSSRSKAANKVKAANGSSPSRRSKAAPKKKSPATKTPRPGQGLQRLNKILAGAGLGSRREVEEFIVQGRVEVDREIVTDLSFKADPSQARIKVDGQVVKTFRPVYFMLNKPKGVLSTNKDPSGRVRVVDLVPDSERVFSVGRLDKSSEGLMLLTNDGELAQKLAHPKFRVQKTYFVVVSGLMTREELAKLKKGVYLSEGFARIDGATIRKQRKASTEMEIVLSEGKNREIRRILARAGHKVMVLRRIAIGTLRLGQLPVGASRQLTPMEVKALYALAEAKPKKKKADATGKSSKSKKDDSSPKPSKSSANEPMSDMDDEFISTSFSFDEFDDDFVGGFSGTAAQGSVIAYDEKDSATVSRSPKRKSPKTGRKQGSSSRSSGGYSKAAGRGKKATGRGPKTTSRAKKPTGKGTATKKKAVKKTSVKTAGRRGAGRGKAAGARKRN
ncbi:MAG: pseudouridine synthase [Planctomycetota bacterium]